MSLPWTVDVVLTCGFPLSTCGDGTRHREPLTACAAERFDEAAPARPFHWAKGRAFPRVVVVVDHVGACGVRVLART
jgi:hypothetical protein